MTSTSAREVDSLTSVQVTPQTVDSLSGDFLPHASDSAQPTSALATSESRSLGASIPEELFEHILWHAMDIHLSYASESSRHILATCGCVCRYWSGLCRPRLFSEIIMKSYADLKGYAELLSLGPIGTLPPIASYVQSVQAVSAARKEPPWMHHIPKEIMSRLPSCRGIHLQMQVNDDGLRTVQGTKALTLHRGLPRSIPSCYSPITQLELTRVHFDSGPVLLKYLQALVSLEWISLDRVSWGTYPTNTTFLPPAHGKLCLETIYTSCDVGDFYSIWFLPALLSHKKRQRKALEQKEYTLTPEEYNRLIELCLAFRPDQSSSTTKSPIEWHTSRNPPLDAENGYVSLLVRAWFLPSYNEFMPQTWFNLYPTNPKAIMEPIMLNVEAIELSMDSDAAVKCLTKQALEMFVKVALQLPRLRHVDFKFDTAFLIDSFYILYRAVLEPLKKAGKLRILWLDNRTETWRSYFDLL